MGKNGYKQRVTQHLERKKSMFNHSIWYILLMILSTILFLLTIWKKKDVKLFILLLFTVGIIYIIEYFVLVIFNGYEYDPNILKNHYYDNIVGAIVSNAFAVPMTSVFIAAFRLNIVWKLVCMGILIGIEFLFVHLGIYKHIWWSYLYTGIAMLFSFFISSKWYSVLLKYGRKRIVQFITLYFTHISILATFEFIVFGIFNLYFYSLEWFNDPYRSNVAISALYIYIISFIIVIMIVFECSWIWLIICLLMFSIVDFGLVKAHILKVTHNWFFGYFFLIRLLVLSCIIMIRNKLLTNSM